MRPFIRQLPRQPTNHVHVQPFSAVRQLRVKEGKAQDPEEVEKAKQNQHHDDEARRELKSGSEEAVGADQHDVKDHDKHMEELQKQTTQKTEENHPEAKPQ